MSGSDSFVISGRLDPEKEDGKPAKDRKSYLTIRQSQGGTGGGADPKEGTMYLETDVGKGGGTGDDTCDSKRKCKVVDLVKSKNISLNHETKKYEADSKAIQSNRNGERAFSADAGAGY